MNVAVTPVEVPSLYWSRVPEVGVYWLPDPDDESDDFWPMPKYVTFEAV